MGLTLQHCAVDTRACGIGHSTGVASSCAERSFVVHITEGGTVICGHCREAVMHGVGLLTHIEFRCEDLHAVWTQTLPRSEPVELHRCELPEAVVTDEEIAALLTSIPLDAP